jgi:hypothetical protein
MRTPASLRRPLRSFCDILARQLGDLPLPGLFTALCPSPFDRRSGSATEGAEAVRPTKKKIGKNAHDVCV